MASRHVVPRAPFCSLALLALFALFASMVLCACSSFQYEDPSPVTTPDPAAVSGLRIPDSPPLRDPFTTYSKVTRDGVTVGYLVRYDPLPAESNIDRNYRAGTIFVENSKFERIGFVTHLGRAYSYEGADSQEVGQGSLEHLLPAYFGEKGRYEVAMLRRD